MLEQEKRKILNNYLYATQQGTLDVACKYINELNEFLSHWDE